MPTVISSMSTGTYHCCLQRSSARPLNGWTRIWCKFGDTRVVKPVFIMPFCTAHPPWREILVTLGLELSLIRFFHTYVERKVSSLTSRLLTRMCHHFCSGHCSLLASLWNQGSQSSFIFRIPLALSILLTLLTLWFWWE